MLPKERLSITGLVLGTIFFAFSLTPSLLPRPFAIQGMISGISLAAGYGLGVAALYLWKYLQLPLVRGRTAFVTTVIAAVLSILVALSFLWRAAQGQNAIRAVMGMEEAPGVHPALIGLVVIVVFLVLLGLGRLFRMVFRCFSRWLHRLVPPRISYLAGIAAAILLFWTVIDGLLVSSVLRVADRSFQQLDALIEDDLPQPVRPEQTGSAESLVNWSDLGRQGRRFVTGGPSADDLTEFLGAPAPSPIRVYVGLNSADTPEERARLALEELKRTGGFERSLLLIVTPT